MRECGCLHSTVQSWAEITSSHCGNNISTTVLFSQAATSLVKLNTKLADGDMPLPDRSLPTTPIWEVSGLYDTRIIILALHFFSISTSVSHSRALQSTEKNRHMNTIHLIQTSPLGREESWARIANFSLQALKEDCRIKSGTTQLPVRKTNSSTPSVAPDVWAGIMLAACLKSAIHIHKVLIKEKVMGSETV